MFSLFKVPYIVLVEILKNYHPSELVCLSLCSRKSHSIVKTLWKLPENAELEMSHGSAPSGQRLSLSPYGEPIIGVEKSEKCPKEKTISSCNVNIGNRHGIKCDMNYCGYLDTYWENDRFGFQEVTNYICDLFKTHITNVSICMNDGFWMFDWIRQRQIEEVKWVFADFTFTEAVGSEEYTQLLRLTPTNSLSLYVSPPEDFHFVGSLPSVKHLTFGNGNWMKLEHLLSLNSETVYIRNTKLTNSDINAYIKHWLSGGFPVLKYILTDVDRRTSHRELYEDIEEQLVKVEEERTYIRKTGEEAIETNRVTIAAANLPYDIRRESDGVVATCFRYRNAFAMVVWPDYDGNRV